MDSIRSLTLEELNREALQRFVEDYQVDQAMIRYLADAAFNVIQCDPTMMPPPATDANRSRYPSPPRSPPARAVRCEDGGLPSLEEFITQLVVSSRVHVATLMPTLVYLNRLKSRLQPMAKGLRCTTHRIFLAALILTAKYLNDSSPKNKHWASYSVITNAAFQFGFSNTEVNLMEKQLLFLLDWDLGVSEEDLYRELDYFLAPIRRKIEAKHHREMRRLAEELQREADMEAEKQRMETRRRQAEKRMRQPEDENDYTFVAAAVSYKTPPPSRGSSRSRSRHASPDSVRDDMPGLYSSSSSYAGSTTSRATTPITDAPADPYTGIYEEVYGSPVVIEAPPVPEKGPNYTIDYCAVPTTRKKLYREIIEDPRSMEDGGRAKRMRGGLRMLERVFGTANGPAGVVVR